MALKLFLLGLPGSGKSTVARKIKEKYANLSIQHVSDYDILYTMFQEDKKSKGGKFIPTKYGGFDVLDFSILDLALRKMERGVVEFIHPTKKVELIMIEFARNDSSHAFRQFSSDFLQGAYVLFLRADTDICKQRIRERADHPSTEEDYFVSDYIFNVYYNNVGSNDLPSDFAAEHGIDECKIKSIVNNGAYHDILEEVEQFIDFIFTQEKDN
jgi:adenylate kinase family enzyme